MHLTAHSLHVSASINVPCCSTHRVHHESNSVKLDLRSMQALLNRGRAPASLAIWNSVASLNPPRTQPLLRNSPLQPSCPLFQDILTAQWLLQHRSDRSVPALVVSQSQMRELTNLSTNVDTRCSPAKECFCRHVEGWLSYIKARIPRISAGPEAVGGTTSC